LQPLATPGFVIFRKQMAQMLPFREQKSQMTAIFVSTVPVQLRQVLVVESEASFKQAGHIIPISVYIDSEVSMINYNPLYHQVKKVKEEPLQKLLIELEAPPIVQKENHPEEADKRGVAIIDMF
jgi:hypothetical protein